MKAVAGGGGGAEMDEVEGDGVSDEKAKRKSKVRRKLMLTA